MTCNPMSTQAGDLWLILLVLLCPVLLTVLENCATGLPLGLMVLRGFGLKGFLPCMRGCYNATTTTILLQVTLIKS